MTFAFQFGRVADGHFTLRFLFEFLGAAVGPGDAVHSDSGGALALWRARDTR